MGVAGWLIIRPYRIGLIAAFACGALGGVFAVGIGILVNTSVGAPMRGLAIGYAVGLLVAVFACARIMSARAVRASETTSVPR